MKLWLFLLACILVKITLGQSPDSTFFFTGYILDEDSIPVENAYLINYRSVRGFATDKNGRFRAKVQAGDSLKINHISYKQKVVYANDLPDSSNIIIASFEAYHISSVPIKYRDVEMERFNRNMALIYAQMKVMPPSPRYQRGNDMNPYAPGAQSVGFGIDLGELIHLFKRKH